MNIPPDAHYLSRRRFLVRVSGALAGLALFGARALGQGPPLWDEGMELDVSFRVLSPGYRAANPYVAVWVENAAGHPVRTLGLWADTRGGSRYVYHLRQWNRFARFPDRTLDHPATLDLTALSRPTCIASTYQLVWDGLDDMGRAVPKGAYRVCVEVAREKSDYGLVRGDVALDGGPCHTTLVGDGPVGDVTVAYRAHG